MIDDISKAFQKVFDAIDEFTEYLNDTLKQRAHESLRLTLRDVAQFEKELEESKAKNINPNILRNECVTFLRDYNIKESYKGTEFVIYILLNHRSTENLKISELIKEIVKIYKTPEHSVRGNLNNALKSVDEEFITAKESLYAIMRDWELYKQEKELE